MDTKPLLNYMQDQGLGTIGVDLFRDNMPTSSRVPRGILITNQTRTKIHPDVRGYVHGLFEITVREESFDAARQSADSVIDVMSSYGVTIGNMRFLFIRAYNTPLVYPVSDGSLVEASVLFDFKFTLF